ncbi:hypothetical protein GGP91_002124 [Salinibacter ruber]|nr:hypothetical protein [Salinibacter ruber]
MFAAISVERSHAREFGNFLTICFTKFRKLHRENVGGCLCHAWN